MADVWCRAGVFWHMPFLDTDKAGVLRLQQELLDSSREDLRGGVKFPTGGRGRDPRVVSASCLALR
jgi:hypothetical protein